MFFKVLFVCLFVGFYLLWGHHISALLPSLKLFCLIATSELLWFFFFFLTIIYSSGLVEGIGYVLPLRQPSLLQYHSHGK